MKDREAGSLPYEAEKTPRVLDQKIGTWAASFPALLSPFLIDCPRWLIIGRERFSANEK